MRKVLYFLVRWWLSMCVFAASVFIFTGLPVDPDRTKFLAVNLFVAGVCLMFDAFAHIRHTQRYPMYTMTEDSPHD